MPITRKTKPADAKKSSTRLTTTVINENLPINELPIPRTDPFAVQFDTSFD
jgi:hypothetical protein